MIGRTATSKCRICRMLGIIPVFFLGCAVAWMATGAVGWIWGIFCFVIVIVCGAMSLRAGCHLAFPDRFALDSPKHIDPDLFSTNASSAHVAHISPGLLDEEQQRSDDGSETLDGPGTEIEDAYFEDEVVDQSQNIFDLGQSELEYESAPGLDQDLEPISIYDEAPTEEITDTDDFVDLSREAESMMRDDPSHILREADDLEKDLVLDPTKSNYQDAFLPQPKSERPSTLTDDPGRRLAQSLVMVGASPALSRASTTSQSVSLRPASLHSARSTGPDDLTLIRGVGSALQNLLHSLGYFHFDQIAAWSPEEVRWVDENLDGFKGRVSRDHWVSQAIVLAQSHKVGGASSDAVPNLRPSGTPDSNTR